MIVGETRLVTATFRLTDGTLVDPSNVVLTVISPSGVTTTPATANPSTGVYTATIDFDEEGFWYWQWSGETSEGSVIAECQACVLASSVLVGT
jgi:hypothetical protein